jgi:hypothetical protein
VFVPKGITIQDVSKGITIQDEVDKHHPTPSTGKHHPTPSTAVDAGWKDEKIERTPSDLSALPESKFFQQRANFQSAKHLLKSLTTSNQIHAKD